jgi:hypothetical protein
VVEQAHALETFEREQPVRALEAAREAAPRAGTINLLAAARRQLVAVARADYCAFRVR